eukprot:TRINITY_DN3826_c0_g1_i1.p1 TRINITY_DN3826_c0_g1~~TRINITY_DN3826_c0_g1_i1.p1  ORF type:complete len:365 (-),score=40.20 TRINITY_DN3826_c0_g1_i1:1128-2171(-)
MAPSLSYAQNCDSSTTAAPCSNASVPASVPDQCAWSGLAATDALLPLPSDTGPLCGCIIFNDNASKVLLVPLGDSYGFPQFAQRYGETQRACALRAANIALKIVGTRWELKDDLLACAVPAPVGDPRLRAKGARRVVMFLLQVVAKEKLNSSGAEEIPAVESAVWIDVEVLVGLGTALETVELAGESPLAAQALAWEHNLLPFLGHLREWAVQLAQERPTGARETTSKRTSPRPKLRFGEAAVRTYVPGSPSNIHQDAEKQRRPGTECAAAVAPAALAKGNDRQPQSEKDAQLLWEIIRLLAQRTDGPLAPQPAPAAANPFAATPSVPEDTGGLGEFAGNRPQLIVA